MAEDFRETLYTVDAEGNRRWVYSELIKGFWFKRRAVVAYSLMVFYLSMPWITIGGRQGVLLDIPNRRFLFFGFEFWATDTQFLFLFFGLLAFSLFFFTAVLGRVWCGWACPETVFLEFLFRPIERLVEGTAAQRRKLDKAPWTWEKIRKKTLKHGLCALFAWMLASTALAYFIGREPLLAMMSAPPHHNLVPFVLTCIMMGIMAFQFGWFREQFCTVLCPYARFQSVLMDSKSIIVGYDVTRGEPRGKLKRGKPQDETGDCIDCGLCVRVCPTGIDIRNGLQLECVACTSCVDACDSIMEKVGRPKGLIRYDTEDRLLGRADSRGLLRPRPFVYGVILTVFATAFVTLLATHETTDFQILRGSTVQPFSMLSDGRVSNQLQIRISNKGNTVESYKFEAEPIGLELIVPQQPLQLQPGDLQTIPIFINFDAELLTDGTLPASVTAFSESGYREVERIRLLGPGR